MLNPEVEKAVLARRLRAFGDGRCSLDEVARVAFEIRDRWSGGSNSTLPPESESEVPLWAVVWELTSVCRESLVGTSREPHPVLHLIAYLEGTEPLPSGWTARRP